MPGSAARVPQPVSNRVFEEDDGFPTLPVAKKKASAASVQSANTEGGNKEWACPACTFLNHPTLQTCEICGGERPRASVDDTGRQKGKKKNVLLQFG